jgi:pimeloyl-ACP methyl ester carboxylesterase
MRIAHLGDVTLEYDVGGGSGEPLLLIHGGFIADAFFPLLAEPRIGHSHRLISYHRRGYAGSSRATAPFTIGEQAADARALLRHLGISRAHVAGHSYGGAIAIQLALDSPDLVGSLALLEPALVYLVPSGPVFGEMLGALQAMYRRGERTAALDGFLSRVVGREYREVLQKFLPPGAFELAVADAQTTFGVEAEALQQWAFTAEDAARIEQPVLAVIGEGSEPIFSEIHVLLRKWIPHAEELVVREATHALEFMNPQGVADGLARFLDRHRLTG